MMNASTAHQLAIATRECAIANIIDEIEDYINDAANAGEFTCCAAFPIPHCYKNMESVLMREVENELAVNGFKYGNQSENVDGEWMISIWW